MRSQHIARESTEANSLTGGNICWWYVWDILGENHSETAEANIIIFSIRRKFKELTRRDANQYDNGGTTAQGYRPQNEL